MFLPPTKTRRPDEREQIGKFAVKMNKLHRENVVFIVHEARNTISTRRDNGKGTVKPAVWGKML